MFTGLVETIGTISSIKDNPTAGGTITFTISSPTSLLSDVQLGDSISINGACLTVTSFHPSTNPEQFTVDIAPETLRRTNLGSLKQNSRVNLERSVRADTRMGGHFVQGHIDTTARIENVTPDSEALVFRLVPRDQSVLRYIVEKGYVTLDGASLTITKVVDPSSSSSDATSTNENTNTKPQKNEGYWEIMLIPYTQEKIVTASKKAGEEVNVEIDVVGKYVERSVEGYFNSRTTRAEDQTQDQEKGIPSILEKMVGRIVDEKLKAAGIGK